MGNKRKSAFKQQCFKLDEEWKAYMEAKVDSMAEPMVEIKAMLHKRHGHFEVDTYTDLSTTTIEGTPTTMARNGNFFKEMEITLVPFVSTLVLIPPSLKVNHTKLTTSLIEGIGKEQAFVVRNYKHMDEGAEEGGPI